MVEVLTITFAAVAAAMADMGEARRALVLAQDAAKGATRTEPAGWWPQLWGKHRRAAEQRTRSFSVRRLAHLFLFVFGLEHGPRRIDRGSMQETSISFPGGCCPPPANG